VYLDDVIVIGRTFQERLLNLRKVFQPEKCQTFQKEIEMFVGITMESVFSVGAAPRIYNDKN
jgi:hypothetical protein